MALSTPTTITVSVVGLFALIALLAFLRLLLRRDSSPRTRRSLRVGVFLERDQGDEPEPPAPRPPPSEPR